MTAATKIPTKPRLEARTDRETFALIHQAAQLEGRTMTDFMVVHLLDAATQTIERMAMIQVSARAQRQFLQAVSDPQPKAPPALARAFAQQAEVMSRQPLPRSSNRPAFEA
jgi:uncharacterized protein (DUF1778 family)